MLEHAHHEASHALRMVSAGWPIVNIGLNREDEVALDDADRTSGVLVRDKFEVDHVDSVHVGLAGPLATMRFLLDHPVWPPVGPGDGESTTELRLHLMEATQWVTKRGRRVGFSQLTVELFRHCLLSSNDDYSKVFDDLIALHINRHHCIPNRSRLFRAYRWYERLTRTWVDENWSHIHMLATRLTRARRTSEFRHFMTGEQVYAWAIKRGVHPRTNPFR